MLYLEAEKDLTNVGFESDDYALKDRSGKTYQCLGMWSDLGIISSFASLSSPPRESKLVFELPRDQQEFVLLMGTKEMGPVSLAE